MNSFKYKTVRKIAFAGTHGVGKTTIIKTLAEKLNLKDVNIIQETAPKVFEMGKTNPALAINQGATLEGQLHIIGMQIEQENRQCAQIAEDDSTQKILLCDRTAFDAVAYTHARTFRDDKYPWARNLSKFLYQWVIESLNESYDVVFYIPITFPLVSNEVRPADPAFQEEIDELMQDIFIRHKLSDMTLTDLARVIKHTEILSGSVDRRVSIVEKTLEKCEKGNRPQPITLSGGSSIFGGIAQVLCARNSVDRADASAKMSSINTDESPVPGEVYCGNKGVDK